MDALRMATLSPMTEEDAEMLLRTIKGMALWTPEMLVELSLNGFEPLQIVDKLQNEPMFLIAYLAIHNSL